MVALCIKYITDETVVGNYFIIHGNETSYCHLVIGPERKKTKEAKE
jgi:hypothetical protein